MFHLFYQKPPWTPAEELSVPPEDMHEISYNTRLARRWLSKRRLKIDRFPLASADDVNTRLTMQGWQSTIAQSLMLVLPAKAREYVFTGVGLCVPPVCDHDN